MEQRANKPGKTIKYVHIPCSMCGQEGARVVQFKGKRPSFSVECDTCDYSTKRYAAIDTAILDWYHKYKEYEITQRNG